MADWKKMERHVRYNRIACWVRVVAILLMADEIYSALEYHFPIWADIALPVTFVLHQIGLFVQRHTEMYRIDY